MPRQVSLEMTRNIGILAVVRVHLQNTADSLIGILHRVVNAGAGVNGAGIYTEEGDLTNKRVGCNFKS